MLLFLLGGWHSVLFCHHEVLFGRLFLLQWADFRIFLTVTIVFLRAHPLINLRHDFKSAQAAMTLHAFLVTFIGRVVGIFRRINHNREFLRVALICGVKVLTAFFKCYGKLLGALACHELSPVTFLVWLEAILLDLRLEYFAIQRNFLLNYRLTRLLSRLLCFDFFIFSLLLLLL